MQVDKYFSEKPEWSRIQKDFTSSPETRYKFGFAWFNLQNK
jgi:hypothetical protein